MPLVAQNFDAIDFDQKGYVTLPEVRAFVARVRSGGQPAESNRLAAVSSTRGDVADCALAARLTRHPPLGLIRPDFIGRKPFSIWRQR